MALFGTGAQGMEGRVAKQQQERLTQTGETLSDKDARSKIGTNQSARFDDPSLSRLWVNWRRVCAERGYCKP
jgi:hypothetical protein